MEYEYQIDPREEIIHIRAKGKIATEDLIQMQKVIWQDPAFDKKFNSLIDLAHVIPSHTITIEKITEGVEFIKSIQRERGKCKWAFIESEHAFGFLHIFALLGNGLDIKIKVFTEEKTAKEWLSEENST